MHNIVVAFSLNFERWVITPEKQLSGKIYFLKKSDKYAYMEHIHSL